jgi:vacuolar protein sorting-associated protein 13A/C
LFTHNTGIDRPAIENTLKTDGYGSFAIGGMIFSWVSFLDGMQRVLFFTHNVHLADRLARTTGESERIEQEVEVSIHGIGISLVNNAESVRRELAYLTVSSSDIVWEVRREGKQRYKALLLHQCQLIEADFMQFNRLLAVGQSPDPRRVIENDSGSPPLIVHYLEVREYMVHMGWREQSVQQISVFFFY